MSNRLKYVYRWNKSNPIKCLLHRLRRRAKLKNMECTLTEKDIVIPTHCPVLGFELKLDNDKQQYNSPSVDRLDSSKGYTPDNIRVISWRANNLKKDSTIEEIERVFLYMRDNQKSEVNSHR